MKNKLLAAVLLMILATAALLCIPVRPLWLASPEMAAGKSFKRETIPAPADGTTAPLPPKPASFLPEVTMTAVDYTIDPNSVKLGRENPPFEFRGGAGTGRVIDHQGKVLLESSKDIQIFGASVSPDRKKVLVDAANSLGGNSLVLEPGPDHITQLPSRPPGTNMFSLSWQWIGPNQLFGISGVEKLSPDGESRDCCNNDNIAQTKFYVFDLTRKQLFQVRMPGVVGQPVVHAADVRGDGYIHLRYDELHEGVEQDLGWFKIDEW